jgi:hypothetical protein
MERQVQAILGEQDMSQQLGPGTPTHNRVRKHDSRLRSAVPDANSDGTSSSNHGLWKRDQAFDLFSGVPPTCGTAVGQRSLCCLNHRA